MTDKPTLDDLLVETLRQEALAADDVAQRFFLRGTPDFARLVRDVAKKLQDRRLALTPPKGTER